MNERIRELKNQTLDKHFSYTWSKMDYDDVTKFAEKFAELIVRECMDLLEDYTTDVNVGGIQYNVLSAEETLQKHFGLE